MKQPITNWVKRTQSDYTLGFKLAVVNQVEQGNFTYKQAQIHYGIQGRSTVLVWLREYGKLNWSKPICMPDLPKSKETSAQKIKRLECKLKEQLKHIVLNKMVNIMDKEHGAGLRKSTYPESQAKQRLRTHQTSPYVSFSRYECTDIRR